MGAWVAGSARVVVADGLAPMGETFSHHDDDGAQHDGAYKGRKMYQHGPYHPDQEADRHPEFEFRVWSGDQTAEPKVQGWCGEPEAPVDDESQDDPQDHKDQKMAVDFHTKPFRGLVEGWAMELSKNYLTG